MSSSQGHAAAAATAAGGGPYGYDDEHDREDVIQPVLYSLAWNPTGDRVVAGYGDGSIRVWDVGKGDSLPPLVGYFQAYDKSIKRVGWRGAGKYSFFLVLSTNVAWIRFFGPKENQRKSELSLTLAHPSCGLFGNA